jgi:SH3-like domain-containing protein
MKKFASWLVVGSVLAAGSVRADSMKVAEAPVVAPALSAGAGTVLKNNVNVRARPDKNSEVIAQLQKGDRVEVKERKGEWLRIVAPPQAKCYVASKFVQNGAVSGDAVNVRSGPGTNFRDIGKLAKGEPVQVVETKGEWTQIKPTPNCSGWVAAELVEIAEPTPPSAPIHVSEAPLPPPAPPAVQMVEPAVDVQIQYVVKDGIFAVVTDANAPAPYALLTQNLMGRQYIIAYLESNQTNLSRYDGKHVRVLGNQRWKRGDRYPVIAIERCDMVW